MKLDPEFLDRYRTKQPSWGPVGEITYLRTYARPGESWWSTCARVVEGCYSIQESYCTENNLPWRSAKAQYSAQQMYALMFDFKFLPPGRGLWAMGTDAVASKGGAVLNNCGFVDTTNPVPAFCWLMDMSMLGVGVGFNTAGYEALVFNPIPTSKQGVDVYQVEDSREGWIEALRRLLSSYMHHSQGCVVFDYSRIRPAGSVIAGFGGTSSGPEPLKEMLDAVREVLYKRIGKNLGVTAVVDIANLIGRCVVAGNIRRSAEIAISELTEEYAELKNAKKWPEQVANHRWAANHTVLANEDTDYESLCAMYSGVPELGVFWLDSARDYGRMGRRPTMADRRASGCNPCAEQTLEDLELCCLVEVFPSRHESYYELQRTLKYAYLYAKTVTLVETHDPRTNRIIQRNRRIGCSLTGIQGAIGKFGSRRFYDFCDRGYEYLRALDDRYSEWFRVNRSVKLTSVKPSGTVSKLPGVSSGIHYPPAEYYFQVIRFATDSQYVPALRTAGYRCIDLSPGEPNTTAVYFPVHEPYFTRAESDVPAWEQAMNAVQMQHYWADNQVSITVKYSESERKHIPRILEFCSDKLKAISFLPAADHGFEHAPWQPIDKAEYEEYVSSLTTPDFDATVHELTDEFCDGVTCEIQAKG